MSKSTVSTRRRFLKMASIGSAIITAFPFLGHKALASTGSEPVKNATSLNRRVMEMFGIKPDMQSKRLVIHNIHNDEMLDIVYYQNGDYQQDALQKINHIMRDRRDQSETKIDPKLLDVLHEVVTRLGFEEGHPIELISGYRSPKSNAMLAKNSNGVAKKSYHMKGMAADIRFKGVSPKKVAHAARDAGLGGYAYYGRSNFTHVDTGPVRTWRTS